MEKLIAPEMTQSDADMDITCEFTISEIEDAIRKLKVRKAAGSDDIHNEMLKNLSRTHRTPSASYKRVLEIVRCSPTMETRTNQTDVQTW